MKKETKLFIALTSLLLLTACSNKDNKNESNNQEIQYDTNTIINHYSLEQANFYITNNVDIETYANLHKEYSDMRIFTAIEIEDENVNDDEIIVDLYGVSYGDYTYICLLDDKPKGLIKEDVMEHTPVINYKLDKAGTYFVLFNANVEKYTYHSYANIAAEFDLELGKHYVITIYDEDYIINHYN